MNAASGAGDTPGGRRGQPAPRARRARLGANSEKFAEANMTKGDWPRRIAEYARDDQEDAAAYAANY